MRGLLLLAALAIGLFSCGPAASTASPPLGASGQPPASTAASHSPSAFTTVADNEGLRLSATFDRLEVVAGGDLTVDLSIENTRSTKVVFEEPCHQEVMVVELRAPVEPRGREWNGIAAAFKAYALAESTGSPIESSIRGPLRTTAIARPCTLTDDGGMPGLPSTTIPAGATYETVLSWTAEIVRGVPALPGRAPFSIRVLHGHEPAGNRMTKAETLEASGTITVLPGAPSAVSAAQAIDATLSDRAFAAWLSKQPQRAWVNANLFLQPAAVAVDALPAVPYWDVELFREPRNWAILYVDAMTGTVLRRNFCDRPCDR